jgi:hypothetical protein
VSPPNLPPQPRVPVPGEVLAVGRSASVQFGGDRRLIFRVISVSDAPTYHGWAWMTGYTLDRTGRATDRREIYVDLRGLRVLGSAPAAGPTPRRTPDTRIPGPRRQTVSPARKATR